MREGLIDDLRKQVQIKSFFGEADADHTKLMREAADALEEYQKLQYAKSEALYLTGDNILEQIEDLNKKRAEKGLPPL